MDYPFQIGLNDQQTQKEKDHINKFYGATQVEFTYENRGKKRKVVRVFLPKGCVTEDTVYAHKKEGTFYHTPLAKLDGLLGRVIYEEDGKPHSCDSKEWMKWVQGGSVEHTPNAAPEPNPLKQAMMKVAKQLAGESELGKDAKWESPQQIKKSSK